MEELINLNEKRLERYERFKKIIKKLTPNEAGVKFINKYINEAKKDDKNYPLYETFKSLTVDEEGGPVTPETIIENIKGYLKEVTTERNSGFGATVDGNNVDGNDINVQKNFPNTKKIYKTM